MPLKLPSRRVAGLWLAGVLCAAAAGAAVLPARWVLALLPADAPVTLADASGTLWHGSAWIALGAEGARRVLPQPVQWQWRWDTMALDISHPWLQGALRARPGWNGLALPASSLRVPATVLPALGAPWNTLSPQGMLEISWQPLRLGAPLPPARPWTCAGATPRLRSRPSRQWGLICCACRAVKPARRWSSARKAACSTSRARAATAPEAMAPEASASRAKPHSPDRRMRPIAPRWTVCCRPWAAVRAIR